MIKVLIVDDDFMVARIHSGFVAQMPGFEVAAVARNGAQALVEAARITPDLVLLDIHLPDISGLDLLSQLRAAVPDLDVLVISGAVRQGVTLNDFIQDLPPVPFVRPSIRSYLPRRGRRPRAHRLPAELKPSPYASARRANGTATTPMRKA